jgi:hypothetical protein
VFGKKVASEKHHIAVMDSRGDTRVEWDLSDPQSLAQAKEVFEQIKKKGGAVFRAQPNGEGGGKLNEFDPHADMIGVPAIIGG